MNTIKLGNRCYTIDIKLKLGTDYTDLKYLKMIQLPKSELDVKAIRNISRLGTTTRFSQFNLLRLQSLNSTNISFPQTNKTLEASKLVAQPSKTVTQPSHPGFKIQVKFSSLNPVSKNLQDIQTAKLVVHRLRGYRIQSLQQSLGELNYELKKTNPLIRGSLSSAHRLLDKMRRRRSVTEINNRLNNPSRLIKLVKNSDRNKNMVADCISRLVRSLTTDTIIYQIDYIIAEYHNIRLYIYPKKNLDKVRSILQRLPYVMTYYIQRGLD